MRYRPRTGSSLALAALVTLVVGWGQARPAMAQSTVGPNDYADPASWLCRPGREDACAVDLTTTAVAADGTLTKETWAADPKAPIDCFYVYPTVSMDPTGNSDMVAGPEERLVIRSQFARFAAQCRPYAPLYRQVTLTALRALLNGGSMEVDRALGYNDVVDAWNYYLEHDNRGRGVVLIGHSQGSGVLTQLIRNEVDGKPVQKMIVSALLLGTSLPVPEGRDVGGAFEHMPLCHSASQTGCIVTYASFRSTVPPPPDSRFGRAGNDGQEGEEKMVAACTNPASLGGGTGELHAYLSAAGRGLGSSAEPAPWVESGQPIATPFVSVPGMLTAQCVTGERGSYLEVTVHGDPEDPRVDDIVGDVVVNGEVQANWGLHLIDVHLAMGNLLEIVGRQAQSYLGQGR